LAAPDAPLLPVLQPGAQEADPERWVGPVGKIALTVFVAVPIFALLVPSLAGRFVWTVLIAGLPLFIVLAGYHRWRRICPLAFFAQIPARFNRSGKRRAPPWLEKNYYYVAFGVFFVSLWLRLNATNGNGYAIAIFFVTLSVAAIAVGFLYTGKTWCNFLCPVSFVEKIYTEPHGLRETANSQCRKCTHVSMVARTLRRKTATGGRVVPGRRSLCSLRSGVSWWGFISTIICRREPGTTISVVLGPMSRESWEELFYLATTRRPQASSFWL